MSQTTKFSICRTNVNATYTMAYLCHQCSEPVVGFGNEAPGPFYGTCAHGHQSTVVVN
ncbi:hypothetical protein AB0I81_34955 [Nonomuraea sp. NPDC050404]|uniref:hypothetical protein n=1 Tax=Nonomuraea sp. NPDC050404 TaxID=3155783 RepID=UPI0033F22929